MSTRGLLMWQIDGERHGYFNHWDSYPRGLGDDLVGMICSYELDVIKSGLLSAIPSSDAGENATEFLSACISNPGVEYEDAAEFFLDDVWCEWAYIINFDTMTFDVFSPPDRLASLDLSCLKESWERWKKKRLDVTS